MLLNEQCSKMDVVRRLRGDPCKVGAYLSSAISRFHAYISRRESRGKDSSVPSLHNDRTNLDQPSVEERKPCSVNCFSRVCYHPPTTSLSIVHRSFVYIQYETTLWGINFQGETNINSLTSVTFG